MKVFVIAAAIAALLCVFPPANPADSPPLEAVSAAEAGLGHFLTEVVPPSELVNFGFAEGEDASAARIVEPWLLHAVTPAAIRSATAETDVGELVTPTGLWLFPVVLGGRARCIITVERMEKGWEAVGIGNAALAVELEKIARQWPKSGGYSPKLVAVYQAAAYFFTVPEAGGRNFTPLTFDGVGFGGYYQRALPEYSVTAGLGEVINPLKEAVEANIAGRRAPGEGGRE